MQVDTIALIADVRRWLIQPADDTAVGKLEFLEDIRRRAVAAGRGAGRDDWGTQGRTARALWAAGRYRRAIERFDHARDLILGRPGGIDGLRGDDRQLAWDVLAARAECWNYIGFPESAIAELEAIPTIERRPWYEWSRAFALHQLGFAEWVPFGTAPGEAQHAPGAEARYSQSNDLIAAIKPRLAAEEQFDIELLRAANWGAICRRRQMRGGDAADAEAQAGSALSAFMRAPPPSSNSAWTWEKEKRGRFPVFELPGDQDRGGKAIRVWRTAYREHYHMNLRRAGLPDRSSGDVVDAAINGRGGGRSRTRSI
jgi:hypothetical protein